MIRQNSPVFTRSRLLAVAAAGLLAVSAQQAEAHNNVIGPTGAAIVGGIAGVAVGAALANGAARNNGYGYHPYAYQPVQAYPPAYPNRYYNSRPFSPDAGVVCYPNQQVCYNNNGTVANRWTSRVFGY